LIKADPAVLELTKNFSGLTVGGQERPHDHTTDQGGSIDVKRSEVLGLIKKMPDVLELTNQTTIFMQT